MPSEDREAEFAATTAAAVEDAVESIPDHGPDDIAAAAEIRTWFQLLKTIGAAAETKVMRACWRIRQAHPDAEDFGRFVHTQLDGLMAPRKAWLLADTWEVASKNRKIAELAARKPDKAIRVRAGLHRRRRGGRQRPPRSCPSPSTTTTARSSRC